jgi:hypothetical protein
MYAENGERGRSVLAQKKPNTIENSAVQFSIYGGVTENCNRTTITAQPKNNQLQQPPKKIKQSSKQST